MGGWEEGREGWREGWNVGTEIRKAKLIRNFPKLVTDTRPHQEAQKTPRRINTQSIPYSNCRKPKTRKNLERSKKGVKTPYLQRNKDKNYIRFLIRNHTNKIIE